MEAIAMRRIAWGLLLLFAFAIPWEYSLDLGEPLGNIARLLGLLVLLAAIPAVLQAGRLRTPGLMLWLVLALYLWFCCSYFWTTEPLATLDKMRGYFQEMMLVWLVWEFAESPSDLRALLQAYVAGSWVLAVLTVVNVASTEAIAAGQIRFAATGQDPNDVARFLDLALGLVAVLLTASRGGFLAGVVALAGCGVLLMRNHAKAVIAGTVALPAIAAALWMSVPHETLERLATIPEQLQSGDLNQRLNIWNAGWDAFVRAPLFGSGAGSFASVAGLNPLDTAHNTTLAILVSGGLCAFSLAVAIVVVAAHAAMRTSGPLRLALVTALLVWMVTSLVATVEESRTTWLLLGLIALAGRLAVNDPNQLAKCFPDAAPVPAFEMAHAPLPSAGG
jgi:O-antigen ligase